ncbi:hypothetical protein CPB97_001356 [Podila verticillata]|nr:hypothetical protein CPB97_001356 [Podila verticillata]
MALWTNHWNDRSRTSASRIPNFYGASIPNFKITHTIAKSSQDPYTSTSSWGSSNNNTLPSTNNCSR